MTTDGPIIELNAARIFQRENLILDDVSFSVRKGEFIYLIGRTGSGKSSLMRTLYGDLPLTQGEGHVCGYDLRKLKRREVPYLRRSWASSSRISSCWAIATPTRTSSS